jgi:hypothetical protein
MTVVELEVILHYAYCPYDPENQSPAYRNATVTLFRAGLLQPGTRQSQYEITDKGRAFVEALKNVPLPVCQWVVPSPA